MISNLFDTKAFEIIGVLGFEISVFLAAIMCLFDGLPRYSRIVICISLMLSSFIAGLADLGQFL